MTRKQEPGKDRSSTGREGLRNVLSLCAVALIVLAARSVVADHYIVPTGSMEPTVQVGDRLVVDKAAYGIRIPFTKVHIADLASPQVGDVVVLSSPEDGQTLLKRVTAVPGDEVSVDNGQLRLNGELQPIYETDGSLLEELNGVVHGVHVTMGGGPDLEPMEVPPHRFLVMGDNRGNSHDGRQFGLVFREAILGKALGVFYSRNGITWRDL